MRRPTMLLSMRITLILLLVIGAQRVEASDTVRLSQSEARLDRAGHVPKDAWEHATPLTTDAIEVVDLMPLDPEGAAEDFALPTRKLGAQVRALLIDGCLALRAEVAEAPSTEIGLGLMIVNEGARAAASGSTFLYQPYSPRAEEYVVYTPRGVGRETLWCMGRTTLAADRYVVEFVVPLAGVVEEADRSKDLRVAAMIFTRTPNRFITMPAGARWKEPDQWQRLGAPDTGWPDTLPKIDAEALRAAEEADDVARQHWRTFQQGTHALQMQKLLRGNPDLLTKELNDALFAPLVAMRMARPPLATLSYLTAADIHRQLGRFDAAHDAFTRALEAMPGNREAQAALLFQVLVPQWVNGKAGTPTDFEAMHAAVEAAAKELGEGNPYLADATLYAHARLRQRSGERVKTPGLLQRLARRYPAFRELTFHAEAAAKDIEAWPHELLARRKDKQRTLPRAILHTSRGQVVVELFEDRAPNTVNNFVYLARAAFFDGLRFHRVLPGFSAQTGDPFSRGDGDAEKLATGGPGYAIPYEKSGRWPFRGMVAMAHHGRDTEGSQFVLLTGDAGHLADEITVFGRIVEGQAVADALGATDRIERVELAYLTEGRSYHPNTIAGTLAPEPKPTSFR